MGIARRCLGVAPSHQRTTGAGGDGSHPLQAWRPGGGMCGDRGPGHDPKHGGCLVACRLHLCVAMHTCHEAPPFRLPEAAWGYHICGVVSILFSRFAPPFRLPEAAWGYHIHLRSGEQVLLFVLLHLSGAGCTRGYHILLRSGERFLKNPHLPRRHAGGACVRAGVWVALPAGAPAGVQHRMGVAPIPGPAYPPQCGVDGPGFSLSGVLGRFLVSWRPPGFCLPPSVQVMCVGLAAL